MIATIPVPAPAPPLGIVTPGMQLEHNRQGLRAIFAGFVIASRARKAGFPCSLLRVSDMI